MQKDYPLNIGTRQTTYMVHCPGQGEPKRHHEKLHDAKNEAIRITKMVGKPTYVLQVLKKYDTTVTEISHRNKI